MGYLFLDRSIELAFVLPQQKWIGARGWFWGLDHPTLAGTARAADAPPPPTRTLWASIAGACCGRRFWGAGRRRVAGRHLADAWQIAGADVAGEQQL